MKVLSIMCTCNKTQQDAVIIRTNAQVKRFLLTLKNKHNTTLTSSHLLEDISQFLIVVNVVLLTVFPRCKALLLLLHIHLPNKQEVGRLHHPQLAAGSHQSPQPFYYLRFLPLEETGAEYEQTKLLALLQDAFQLVCTGHAGTR